MNTILHCLTGHKTNKTTDIGQTFYDNSLEFLALFEKLSLEMNDIVNVQKVILK